MQQDNAGHSRQTGRFKNVILAAADSTTNDEDEANQPRTNTVQRHRRMRSDLNAAVLASLLWQGEYNIVRANVAVNGRIRSSRSYARLVEQLKTMVLTYDQLQILLNKQDCMKAIESCHVRVAIAKHNTIIHRLASIVRQTAAEQEDNRRTMQLCLQHGTHRFTFGMNNVSNEPPTQADFDGFMGACSAFERPITDLPIVLMKQGMINFYIERVKDTEPTLQLPEHCAHTVQPGTRAEVDLAQFCNDSEWLASANCRFLANEGSLEAPQSDNVATD